jgi:hypothetical protein
MNKNLQVIAFVLLAVLIGTIYWWRIVEAPTQLATTPSATSTPTTTTHPVATSISAATSESASSAPAESRPGLKHYRNEEFGFEFWYPEELVWEENTFSSPYSKFNLTAVSISGKKTNRMDYVNIATSELYNNFLRNMDIAQAEAVDVRLGTITGKQYRYISEGVPRITVVFPIRDLYVIFSASASHEDIVHDVLGTWQQ